MKKKSSGKRQKHQKIKGRIKKEWDKGKEGWDREIKGKRVGEKSINRYGKKRLQENTC